MALDLNKTDQIIHYYDDEYTDENTYKNLLAIPLANIKNLIKAIYRQDLNNNAVIGLSVMKNISDDLIVRGNIILILNRIPYIINDDLRLSHGYISNNKDIYIELIKVKEPIELTFYDGIDANGQVLKRKETHDKYEHIALNITCGIYNKSMNAVKIGEINATGNFIAVDEESNSNWSRDQDATVLYKTPQEISNELGTLQNLYKGHQSEIQGLKHQVNTNHLTIENLVQKNTQLEIKNQQLENDLNDLKTKLNNFMLDPIITDSFMS